MCTSFYVYTVQFGCKYDSVCSMPDPVLSTSHSDLFNPQKQIYEIDITSLFHMRLVLVSKWDPGPWSTSPESGHMGCNQCSHPGPHAQKGPCLLLCYCHREILNIFEQASLCFHFTLGLTRSVISPGQGLCSYFSLRYFDSRQNIELAASGGSKFSIRRGIQARAG